MDIIAGIGANKIFVGCAMLLMNLGSRFVVMDITKNHEKILSNSLVKKVIVFCMFFIATRDIMTSIIMTFGFVVIMNGLLNEKSIFNIMPSSMRVSNGSDSASSVFEENKAVTPKEYQDAITLVEKYINQNENGG